MATAVQKAEAEAVGDVEAVAAGYAEAADGNPSLALRWAVQDLLDADRRLTAAERCVSAGYVRAVLPARA